MSTGDGGQGSDQGSDPDEGGVDGADGSATLATDGGPVAYVCGDDVAEGPEVCDGCDLKGASCSTFGLAGDGLECADDCTFDVSDCTGCGNARVDGREECDPAAPVSTCQDLGWEGGALQCTDSCKFDESECFDCGDGLVSGPEECDTDRDLDCTEFGWDAGLASCDGCLVDQERCCNEPGGDCADTSDCCDGECVDRLCGPADGGSGMAD